VDAPRVQQLNVMSDEHIDPVFRATIDAVEESIANAMCMAGDVVGVNGHFVPGLPLDRVRDVVERCTPPELL
jgi:D-aminopeptidase